MHSSSSLTVILCTVLFSQYIYCSPKTDEQWWHNITGVETRQRKTWTTLDSKPTPKPTTQSTRFMKRTGAAFDENSTVRSRNWEKSYARRRDFDSTWKNDKPVRERFVETEWDDDVPVRHVFRDSVSSIDEGPTRNRFGDELPREKMSRPWSRGDSWSDSFSSGRNNNNNKNNRNINSSTKPKVSASTSTTQPKSDRSDRILNLNFQDEESKRKDKERLDNLAKQIFGTMEGVDTTGGNGRNGGNGNNVIPRSNGNNGNSRSNGNNGNTINVIRSNGNNGNVFNRNNGRTNGNNNNNNNNNGNGYVSNAMNTFSSGRSSANTFSNTGSDILRSTPLEKKSEKQTSNKFVSNKEVVTPSITKPKFNAVSQTTSVKPERTSNTAKPNNAIEIKGVAEKPKSSTTPSSPVKFGWRSSINHSGEEKNQKLQNSVSDNNESTNTSEDEEEDDFVDDFEDDLDDTTSTTRPPTRATTRTTARPSIRTTLRPTTMKAGVEYTTYRSPDTTRPQTTTSVTNRPNALTTFTTSRPKSVTPKTTTDLNNDLSPNKKQHRMGSWVDSETLDYVENEDDDFSGADNAAVDAPQPLVGEQEFEDEQLPERVEESPIPQPLVDEEKFARQSAREQEEDGESGRLEDALPGVPGTDYPTFATIPRTAFDCRTHEWPGYYADVETQCQVFHICQTGGRKNSFLCPNGTMFNQQLFVCDWWHNVQCGDSATHFALNENIYDHNWESKRVSATNGEQEANIKRSGAIQAEPLTDTTDAPEDDSGDDSTDSLEKRSDSDNNPIDPSDDYIDEDIQETGKAQLTQRRRSPIRIYRTSRIITDPDRQKRRRRKRGYLKN